MEKNDNLLIVDGDILNFTICRITEDITDFGDQSMESFDEEATVRALENGLDAIAKETGYPRKDIIYALSSDDNFRKRKFPTYKSNRKNVKKPIGLPWLRNYIVENQEKYQLLMMEELEADDAIGISATSNSNCAIYSQDKDLKTIAAKQWDFKKKKFWTPTQLEATRWLYTQVLTGDTVDGYTGCPKIGKVKAGRALAKCTDELEMLESSYVLYYNQYKDIDLAMEKFLEQIGQARILTYIDFIALVNLDETYNPFSVFNVTRDTLESWIEKFNEEKAKKKKKVKDV